MRRIRNMSLLNTWRKLRKSVRKSNIELRKEVDLTRKYIQSDLDTLIGELIKLRGYLIKHYSYEDIVAQCENIKQLLFDLYNIEMIIYFEIDEKENPDKILSELEYWERSVKKIVGELVEEIDVVMDAIIKRKEYPYTDMIKDFIDAIEVVSSMIDDTYESLEI